MAKFCVKCGKELSAQEQEKHVVIEGLGVVCEECSAGVWGEKKNYSDMENEKFQEEKVYDSYFPGVVLMKEGIENILRDVRENTGTTERMLRDTRKNTASTGMVWIKYLKFCQYFIWIIITLAGFMFGLSTSSDVGAFKGFLYALLLGGVGFIAGFMFIAVVMVFLSMAENIARTTDIVNMLFCEITDWREEGR